ASTVGDDLRQRAIVRSLGERQPAIAPSPRAVWIYGLDVAPPSDQNPFVAVACGERSFPGTDLLSLTDVHALGRPARCGESPSRQTCQSDTAGVGPAVCLAIMERRHDEVGS